MSTYYDDDQGFGGTKRFPAKFASKCPVCGERIAEGTMVEATPPDESPTGKWQIVGHAGCKGRQAAAPAAEKPKAKRAAKKKVEVEIPPENFDDARARTNVEVLWNGGIDTTGDLTGKVGKEVFPLDADQDLITRWRPEDGNVRVLAAAGSGKTRTTVALIARLIWDRVFSPGQIVCTTFTKKAGLELIKRFTPVLPPGALDAMRVGTFHSIAGKAAAAAYPARFKWGRNIDVAGGPIRSHALWRQIFGYVSRKESEMGYVRGTDKHSLELKDAEGRMVNVRAYALAVDVARSSPGTEDDVARRLEGAEDEFPSIVEGWRIFCEAKRNQGWWDFADTLQAYEEGLRLGQIKDGVKLIVIDEAQDNNPIQFAIGQHLAKRGNGNIILVGDVRQCQPAGTMVETINGPRPIETLKNGDEVRAWSRAEKYVQQKSGSKIKVACRPYTGPLIRVEAAGKATETTGTHRWLAKWDDSARDLHAVYLMRKTLPNAGVAYRVGWCKILDESNGHKAAHYKLRARIEGADAIWFLRVCHDRAEASAWESIYATRYSIPTVMFKAAGNGVIYSQANLDFIWHELAAGSRVGALQALLAVGLDPTRPLWEAEGPGERNGTRGSRRTLFEVAAINLCPGMAVPVWDGGRDYNWHPVSLLRRDVANLPVYSLDVETHHAYVADALCTLNSIYSWRGAEPEIMVGADETINAKTMEIPTNYRSVRKVVALGNEICEGAPWAIGSPAAPKNKTDGVLTIHGADTGPAEAAYVANEIGVAVSSGARKDYSEVAILTRTNAQGAAMEAALVARRIPAVVVGGTPFFARVEPKAVLAWLRLLDGVFVADDVSRALGFPGTGLGEAYATDLWNRIERGAALYDAVESAASALYSKDPRKRKALDFAATVQGLLAASDEDDARRWRMRIDALAGMFAGEKDDKLDDEDSDDEGALASAVLDLAKTFDRPEEFFQFARQCAGEEVDPQTGEAIVHEVEYEKDPNTGKPMMDAPILPPGRVVISTIHKAKGLEWPVVYVSATRGLFPHRLSTNVAEEQRLFYVAVTRAEKECHLTFHVTSELKGTGGPSSFLKYADGLAE